MKEKLTCIHIRRLAIIQAFQTTLERENSSPVHSSQCPENGHTNNLIVGKLSVLPFELMSEVTKQRYLARCDEVT